MARGIRCAVSPGMRELTAERAAFVDESRQPGEIDVCLARSHEDSHTQYFACETPRESAETEPECETALPDMTCDAGSPDDMYSPDDVYSLDDCAWLAPLAVGSAAA